MADTVAKYIQAIGTFFIGAALLVGIFVAQRTIQGGIQGRTLVVSGKAVRQLSPNQSVLTGTWQERGASSDEARTKVTDAAGKGVAALKAAGIDAKKIETTRASVYPEYDYSGSGSPKITGYQGAVSVQVTLGDTSKAEDIIALLTKNGASSTSGPSLGLSTEVMDQIQKELKVAAVADAAGQAKAMAEQAGGKLGEVVSVSGGEISGGGSTPPYPMSFDSSVKSDASGAPYIATGEKEVSVLVQVTYRLK